MVKIGQNKNDLYRSIFQFDGRVKAATIPPLVIVAIKQLFQSRRNIDYANQHRINSVFQ